MVRWRGDAEERFRAAALALFIERGYEKTTVAEIAERAGLTARTFFRYFSDKREVLFNGSEHLKQAMVEAVVQAPVDSGTVGAIGAALEAAATLFEDVRPFARQRSAVIAANAELRERELIKMAMLSSALAAALQGRGVVEPDASLAAGVCITAFHVAFERWIGDPGVRSFSELARDNLARLRNLADLH